MLKIKSVSSKIKSVPVPGGSCGQCGMIPVEMEGMLKIKSVRGESCGQYGMSPVEKEDGRMKKKKKRTTRMIKYQRG
eukprot:scaffold99242_cov16-Attheya_sp.AAC.1